jgi:exosortase A
MSDARTERGSADFLANAARGAARLVREIRKAPAAARFALLVIIAAIAFPHALTSMAALWIGSSTYHHGVVVFPLAAWLIWRERAAFGAPAPSLAAAAATAPLAVLLLAGRAAEANIVEHFAFISLLIVLFSVAFGLANARRAAFGLLFLYFAVPFGETLTPALRSATAAAVGPLLAASGVALDRDGALISTAVGRFEIADACAGLNFLLAALLIAAVFAAIALRSWKKRLAFLALAATAALVANVLRAYLVILLATKTPLGMDFARDHAGFGWALYAAFLIGLIAIGRRLRDDASPPRPGASALAAPQPQTREAAIAASVMIIAGALQAAGLPARLAALFSSVYGL